MGLVAPTARARELGGGSGDLLLLDLENGGQARHAGGGGVVVGPRATGRGGVGGRACGGEDSDCGGSGSSYR